MHMIPNQKGVWLTNDEVLEMFAISQPTLDAWRKECEQTVFRTAIIRPTIRKTYFELDTWREFLIHKSKTTKEDLIDPHFRE